MDLDLCPASIAVKNLRKKIERYRGHLHFIKTEPWVGYRFETSPETSDTSPS